MNGPSSCFPKLAVEGVFICASGTGKLHSTYRIKTRSSDPRVRIQRVPLRYAVALLSVMCLLLSAARDHRGWGAKGRNLPRGGTGTGHANIGRVDTAVQLPPSCYSQEHS